MNATDIVPILEGATALFGTAIAIRDWFCPKATASNLDPNLKAALDTLPSNTSADEIIKVLQPFYVARGGDAVVRGGHDGGGNVELLNTKIEGGSGVGGGGNAMITGGDGGPNGNGGSVSIVGGVIKGGDAT